MISWTLVGPDETKATRNDAADFDDPMYGEELAPGAQAGDYLIQGTVASGGCGTVYAAEHRILGRRVAIKVLHRALADSSEMIQRFIREARAVNVIRHPNIVDIYDFSQLNDGRPYYVMELLEGKTLDSLLRSQHRLSPAEALAILDPLCAALDAAHRAGIVHREVKASNVFVDEKSTVKLLDFGIAKLLRPEGGPHSVTTVGRQLGTPHAMAPEQIRGEPADPRTDVYALGVLLFEMLTGRFPFESEDPLELERMHLEAPPPRPSEIAAIPQALDELTLRAMEKQPSRRFPSVAEFVAALRDAVGAPSRQGSGARSVRALAIHLRLRLTTGADELDDVLDQLVESLCAHQYQVCVQTGDSLLAARALRAEEDERRAVQDARRLAETLRQKLDATTAARGRIEIEIQCRAGDAVVRDGSGEIVGGDVLKLPVGR